MTWSKVHPSSALWGSFAVVLGCGGRVDDQEPLAALDGVSGSGGSRATLASGGGTAVLAAGGAMVVPASGGTPVSGTATGTGTVAPSTTCPLWGASGIVAPLPPGGVACDSTVVKGGPCSVEGAFCFKTCGPAASGWKSETCTSGTYVEISVCIWTATDYSAFRVPDLLTELSAWCPVTMPQVSTACTTPPCISCADPSTGGYLDSAGNARSGWCTCVYGTADPSYGKWSCGTAGSRWPCPGQPGC